MVTATGTREITLPYKFEPREYQLPLLAAMDSGVKRALVVAHRRSGKDKTCVNIIAKKMYERVGNYYYFFPTYTQAKKVIWDGVDKSGFPVMGHFPQEILEGDLNHSELKVKYKNGSIFQLIGTDDVDRVVGTNPVGVVFSEYALQDPTVWGYIRPILAENDGWAIFIGTPRGENHFYDLYNLAKNSPEWFCQMLKTDDTNAIPKDILEQERREIIHLYGNDALYQQEYLCNFTVPIAGAYYAHQVQLAYQEGRVGNVPYEDRAPVDTWWDLGAGKSDYMAIWFSQSIGAELRMIDYYQCSGQGFPHCAGVLKDKGYLYNTHNAPFDVEFREMGTGKLRIETAKSLGINFKVVPKLPLIDGIDAARSLFRKAWFDKTKCADGLNALKNYQKRYDDDNKCYVNDPLHNWASHGADAFRYCAVGINYVKSHTGGSYVHKDTVTQGWREGNYTPEWSQEDQPIVRRGY